jgi:hypothetical protein
VRRIGTLLISFAAVAVVVGLYVALGGASYEPTAVADPCSTRAWRSPDGVQQTIEQIALSGLDGAACELGTSREELVLALRDEEALDAFAAANGTARDDAEHAVEAAVIRAVDDAEESGALPGFVASIARGTLGTVPPWLLLEALERLAKLLT